MDKQYFINKLSINRPTNFEKYNYDLLPETFKAFDKLSIECFKHGIFNQNAGSHLFGQGCPDCGKKQSENNRALTTNEFINKSKAKYGDKFDYSKTNYTRKDTGVIITCPYHGNIIIRPSAHIWSSHGCQKCDYEIPREISKQKFLEKAKKVHNNKYDYSKVKFINSNDTVEIICLEHGSFQQGLYIHSTGVGCPKCALENNKSTLKQFIEKSINVHGDKYDYSKVNYETNLSMVVITCKKHGDFVQRANSHLHGNGCKKCFQEERIKSTEEFIKNALLIHGKKYDYSKVNYHGNKQPVEIICPVHGSFWQKPNAHVSSGTGCRFCSESKGERVIELFLKKHNINYIREYRLFPNLHRSDFYLPEFKIHIEFNGIQHYKPIELFGGKLAYLKTKENDEIKKQIIKENNEYLIIITYLCLNENSVEKELIRQLKRIYKFWFVIDGKTRVFKVEIDRKSTR